MAETAKRIAQLADANEKAREAAASELYWEGRTLGEAAVRTWRRMPELAGVFSGTPTVGVAVGPETFERIRTAVGMPRLADVPPDQDALEFELHFHHPVRLDVLTTKSPGAGGAIARFLEKFGGGIQQVEFPVADIDRATEVIRTKVGIPPVYPETRPGADGTRVNFFLTSTPDGKKVLIELVEQKRGSD